MRACILFFINKFIDSLHKKCVQQNQSDLKDWNKEQKTDLSLELDSTDTQYIQNYIIYMQRDKEAESGFSHALIYCKWLTEGAGLMTELDSFANCQEIRRKAAFSLTQPKPPATKSVTSIPQEVAVDKGSDKHRVLWMEIVLNILPWCFTGLATFYSFLQHLNLSALIFHSKEGIQQGCPQVTYSQKFR